MMARILCVFVLAWMVAAGQEEDGGKCERIRLSQCQDLGYNHTAMPNLIGHRDQKEAEEAVSFFKVISLILLTIRFRLTFNIATCHEINIYL